MNLDGFWINRNYERIFKVENTYDAYLYDNGDWIYKGFIAGIGTSMDFDSISEEEAMEIIKKLEMEEK